jgi:hypothetical protein
VHARKSQDDRKNTMDMVSHASSDPDA